MKVKLKLIYQNGIYQIGTWYIPKKDLDSMCLFDAIYKRVECFNPKHVLIL